MKNKSHQGKTPGQGEEKKKRSKTV